MSLGGRSQFGRRIANIPLLDKDRRVARLQMRTSRGHRPVLGFPGANEDSGWMIEAEGVAKLQRR